MIGVIGGSGFVGSSILKELKDRELPVHCFDISPPIVNTPFTKLDVTSICSSDIFQGCSTIINLAAVHRDDVRPISKYYDVNVEGARNVCEAASKLA